LTPARLEENEVWRNSHRAVLARYTGAREPDLHKLIIRDIIDREVHNLVATSAESIAESGVQTADDVRWQTAPLIRYSDEFGQSESGTPEIFVSKRLLPSARRGSEPARLARCCGAFLKRTLPIPTGWARARRDESKKRDCIAQFAITSRE